jgi:phage RecT family recombinase
MTTTAQNNGEAGTSLAVVRNRILETVMLYAESIEALAPRGMLAPYYKEELRLYLSQPDKDGNPSKLHDCAPASIARGILRVAQTGLSLGVSCDLLPYGKVCQYSPRYTGIVELALLSGTRAINADVVYDDDILFEYQKGTESYLRHQRGPRKGNITHFYAMGELKPGSYVFEVMTRDEVEDFKKKFSKQWAKVPIEECVWYGKKTLIRQLSKFLPKNPRFASALQFDKQADEIPDGVFEPIDEEAMDDAIMGQRPDAKAAAPAATLEPLCTKEQKERLLDLIEHRNVSSSVGETVQLRLQLGTMTEKSAAVYIKEMEAAINGSLSETPEMAGLGV